jgi:hypothetical protein
VLINLLHHGQEGDHNMEVRLKFEALGLASEAQLDLVEGLHKLVSQQVAENQVQAIAWNWESMNEAVSSIHMALERQVGAVW